jgi:hypothetical protein
MEAIGDITASAEVSRVEVEGEDFESRIQGGVLVCVHLMVYKPTELISMPPSERRSGRVYFGTIHRDSSVYLRSGKDQ